MSDAVFIHGPTIGLGWPAFFFPEKCCVVHHMVPSRPLCGLTRYIFHRVHHVAVSHAVAKSTGCRTTVIGNPYDCDVFFPRPTTQRPHDFIFVGRLIKSKGAHLLIRAFAQVNAKHKESTLTIVGDGEELNALKREAEHQLVINHVRFAGSMSGKLLADTLCEHRFIVIPSLAPEGFGLVALEGLACGCIPIAFDSGGLNEAVGPCGVVVSDKRPNSLCETMLRLKASPDMCGALRAGASAHLKNFLPGIVIHRYLRILAPEY